MAKPNDRYRVETGIDEVENGFIVKVCGDNPKGEYQSKRFVAQTRQQAQSIVNDALSGKIKPRKGNGPHSPSTEGPKLGQRKRKSGKRAKAKAAAKRR